MRKKVAVQNEAVAIPGTKPFSPATPGAWSAWSAGPIRCMPYPKATIKGQKIIHQASCTFTFTGTDAATKLPVSGTERVTVKAGMTKLQKGGQGVLVAGDKAQGQHGNKGRSSPRGRPARGSVGIKRPDPG